MFSLLDLFGWDTTTHDVPRKEPPPMKKQKIREMLMTIISRLDKLAAADDRMTVEEAKRITTEARANAAKIRELESELGTKKFAITRLEQRLAGTERDRDSWKRECERYAAGSSDPRGRD